MSFSSKARVSPVGQVFGLRHWSFALPPSTALDLLSSVPRVYAPTSEITPGRPDPAG